MALLPLSLLFASFLLPPLSIAEVAVILASEPASQGAANGAEAGEDEIADQAAASCAEEAIGNGRAGGGAPLAARAVFTVVPLLAVEFWIGDVAWVDRESVVVV